MKTTPSPCCAEALDRGEQDRDAPFVEHRGRLVQHQHPGVERNRLRDLDHLLLTDAQRAHFPLRFDRNAELVEQGFGAVANCRAIDHAEPSPWKAAEENIVFRREIRRQRQFLVNDDDARGECVARRPKAADCAFDREAPPSG